MSESVPNERIFNPTQYFLGPNRAQALEQPSDIIHHIIHRDRHTGLTRLAFNNLKAKKRADRTLKVDGSSLMIAVDGFIHDPPIQTQTLNEKQSLSPVCPCDELSKLKASYGIFFGPSSLHNKSSFLPMSKRSASKETAILRGCYDALDYEEARKLASEAVEEVRKVGDGESQGVEVRILDMKGLAGEMKALELELQRWPVDS